LGDGLTGQRALVLADAAPDAGRGHLARSGAVAAALDEGGVVVERRALGVSAGVDHDGSTWAPGGVDGPAAIIVLDTYRPDAGLLDAVERVGATVVRFDDGVGLEGPAHLIVEPLAAATSAVESGGAQRLRGLGYACLGRAYWELPERELADEIEAVLVTAGGAAPTDLIDGFTDAIRRSLPDVPLVVGAGAGSLRDAILDADLVVCAAGQTMLEVCACGSPCVAMPVADNQRAGAEQLERLGCVRVASDISGVGSAIAALAANPATRLRLAARGRQAVDGQGARRVAARAQSLAGGSAER
jgi:spore coat polysaccharide biosynthesis predicted glycosyltransferase SpsG